MDHPYLSYFGMAQVPFNITPDPAFLYLSSCHREALAQLSYGIKARKGFVVLTGEVGTGKTTLVHALLGDLGERTHTAFIFSSVVSPLDLLRYVCEEFGLVELKHPQTNIHDCLVLLNDFLLEKYRNGDNCALIIDEAQNLSPEVLEAIRLLSNFETSKDKLFQIVLVGQPELAARLNSQELRQLKQRVTLRYHLRALTLGESRDYIANRLQVAGGKTAVFAADAFEAIYRCSTGIPRLINVLCDNALLTAYALGKTTVDAAIIEEVADDLSIVSRPALVRSVPEGERSAPLRSGTLAEFSRKSATEPAQASSPSPQRLPVLNDLSNVSMSRVNGKASPALFVELTNVLAEAMGPMATIVLGEEIRRLAPGMDAFPQEKLSVLVESVSREILDSSMKKRFHKSAYDLIDKFQK